MNKLRLTPRLILFLVLFVLLLAVALMPAMKAESPSDREPAFRHLPEHPDRLQARLRQEDFSILSWEKAGGGIMGAKKLTLGFHRDGRMIEVKWKKAPRGGDGWNNSPRRELGAWAVQKLFLEPDEYVVPPTAALCIPLEVYRRADEDAKANLPGADCAFGVFSAWLQDVRPPRRLWDRGRFSRNALYARQVAHLNLLTYLINHHDGRKANFLVSSRADDERIFSIDNGLSFSWSFHNFFIRHWNSLRVPALPADTVAMLRSISDEDFERLAVLAQFERAPDGVYRPVAPGRNLDPQKGSRLEGATLQIGLTQGEIEDLKKR
ncbi:MAG TPA: hypothetical protein VLV83_02950, partial [Acidobacteriota bacterium]|nr:hypothetical protein [Acidobacteriota bacterium]